MSFIYKNDKLINTLVQAGLEFDNKFTKNAQQVPTSAEYYSLADKLTDNLLNLTSNPVGTENQSAELNTTNLVNVNTFVDFCATNKITYNSQRLVYHANEAPEGIEKSGYKYLSLSSLDTEHDKQRLGYYINIQFVSEYIKYLQKLAPQSDNPRLMEVYLGRIIKDLNARLKTDLTKELPTQLDKNLVLDMVPEQTPVDLDPSLEGKAPLTVNDLMSPTNFNAWAAGKNIQTEKDGKFYNIKQLPFDICKVIRYLARRAKFKLTSIQDEKNRAAFEGYNNLVSNLAGKLTNFAGQICSIGMTEVPYDVAGGQSTPSISPDGLGGETTIGQLVATMPLDPNVVKINDIKDWLTRATPYIESGIAQEALNNIQHIKNNYKMMSSEQDLNERISEVYSHLGAVEKDVDVQNSSNPGKSAYKNFSIVKGYLDTLAYVVDQTAYAIRSLATKHPQVAKAKASLFNYQIGLDGNYANAKTQNINKITNLKDQLMRLAPQK